MPSLLIIYSTTDGHTKKIAEFIRDRLTDKNYQVESFNVLDSIDVHIEKYEKVIVAASIRYGKFRRPLRQFISRNESKLNKVKTGFVSVNLIARKPEKNTPETNVYTRKYLKKISWKPDLVCVVGGMLNYPIYNFFDRQIIRLIMKITGGPTDPSSKLEFTDWNKLGEFADNMIRI